MRELTLQFRLLKIKFGQLHDRAHNRLCNVSLCRCCLPLLTDHRCITVGVINCVFNVWNFCEFLNVRCPARFSARCSNWGTRELSLMPIATIHFFSNSSGPQASKCAHDIGLVDPGLTWPARYCVRPTGTVIIFIVCGAYSIDWRFSFD